MSSNSIPTFIHPNPNTFNSPRRQYFSLPYGLISYITAYPLSIHGYRKLQKTCKYFFSKSKIVVVDKYFVQKRNYLVCYIFNNYTKPEQIVLKEKYNIKYWCDELSYDYLCRDNLEITFSNHIYFCNFRALKFVNVNLFFKDLIFLMNGGKLTSLSLNETKIKNDDSSLVSINEILAKSSNLTSFKYTRADEIFTNDTLENMILWNFAPKRKDITVWIHKLPPDANILLLCDFVKNMEKGLNQDSIYSFHLYMKGWRNYKIILKKAFAEMIEKWDSKIKPSVRIC